MGPGCERARVMADAGSDSIASNVSNAGSTGVDCSAGEAGGDGDGSEAAAERRRRGRD